MYGTGDTYRRLIVVTADDGALTAATFGTGVLRVSGTDSGATVTITTIATGVYEASVALSGTSAGNICNVRVPVTRTSDSKVTTWISEDFRIGADIHSIRGTAQTARDIGASVLLSSGTGTGQINLSSGNVMPQNLTGYSAVYYVSPTGNNSNSGLTPALAKLTITSAKAAASAGSLIRVLPGTYTSDTNLLKDGVDMYFAPGAIVDFQDASPASENMLSDEDGAVRCRVMGYGQFVRSVVDNSINLVHITNANSRVWIEAAELGRDENDIHDHAIYITAGTVDITIPRIDTLAMASGRAIDIGGGTVRFHGDILCGDGIDITGAADVTTFGRIQSSNLGVYPRGAGVTYRAYGDITAVSEPLKLGPSATGVAIFDGVTLRRTGGTDPAIRAENGVSSSMLVVMRRSLVLAPGTYSAVGDAGASLTLTVDQHTTLQKPLGANVSLAYTNTASALSTLTAAQVNAEADAALADAGVTTTVMGRIDVASSSRLAAADYTAPLNAAGTRAALGMAAADLDSQLDAIGSGSGGGSAPTAAEVAEAVRLVLSGRDLVVRSGYANGTIYVVRGAAYGTATNNQIDIPKATSSQYPTDLTGYTVVIAAEKIPDDVTSAGTTTASFSASVVNPSTTQTIRLQLAAGDTTALAVGNWRWHARATKSGVASPIILCGGLLRIEEEIG